MQWEIWLRLAGYRPEDGYRLLDTIPTPSTVPVIVTGEAAKKASTWLGADDVAHIVVDGRVERQEITDIVDAQAVIVAPKVVDIHELTRLLSIMEQLRSERGCAWDREQTHVSLRRYLIEEAYEVAEAIDTNDMELLCEELGDVLLQVVFHSQIAKEQEKFNFFTICREISQKMIFRHPHVFKEPYKIGGFMDKGTWEARKHKEKKRKNLLDGVFWGLPSLLFACKIQEKTAHVGFDWDSVEPIWEKLEEEWQEVRQAITDGNPESLEEECGDVLFTTVNILRHLGVEPETALRKANEKFCRRFRYVESCVQNSGKEWHSVSLQEMDMYWKKAKRQAYEPLMK